MNNQYEICLVATFLMLSFCKTASSSTTYPSEELTAHHDQHGNLAAVLQTSSVTNVQTFIDRITLMVDYVELDGEKKESYYNALATDALPRVKELLETAEPPQLLQIKSLQFRIEKMILGRFRTSMRLQNTPSNYIKLPTIRAGGGDSTAHEINKLLRGQYTPTSTPSTLDLLRNSNATALDHAVTQQQLEKAIRTLNSLEGSALVSTDAAK